MPNPSELERAIIQPVTVGSEPDEDDDDQADEPPDRDATPLYLPGERP